MPWSIISFWARICIAYHISHIMPCLHHVACAFNRGWLLFPLLVFLPLVEPGDEFVNEEPVEYAYEDQVFINSENFAGKMTTPSKSLLFLVASFSLYCYAAIPTTCFIVPPILPYWPYCYVVLLSPSYSVASCRWRWSLFLVGTWILFYILFTLMHLYTW